MYKSTVNPWKDWMDRSASPRQAAPSRSDVVAAIISIVASLGPAVGAVDEVLSGVFHAPGSLAPLVFAITGLLWCWFAVTSKSATQASSILVPDGLANTYRFAQSVRLTAKVGFLLLVVLVPIKSWRFYRDVVPLPPIICGLVTDSYSNPVTDAVIRIITADGVDISKEPGKSDDRGIFILTANYRIPRDARLKVVATSCTKQAQDSAVRYMDEADLPKSLGFDPAGHPSFRIVLRCGGDK